MTLGGWVGSKNKFNYIYIFLIFFGFVLGGQSVLATDANAEISFREWISDHHEGVVPNNIRMGFLGIQQPGVVLQFGDQRYDCSAFLAPTSAIVMGAPVADDYEVTISFSAIADFAPPAHRGQSVVLIDGATSHTNDGFLANRYSVLHLGRGDSQNSTQQTNTTSHSSLVLGSCVWCQNSAQEVAANLQSVAMSLLQNPAHGEVRYFSTLHDQFQFASITVLQMWARALHVQLNRAIPATSGKVFRVALYGIGATDPVKSRTVPPGVLIVIQLFNQTL